MVRLQVLTALLLSLTTAFPLERAPQASNNTVDNTQLKTWWHSTGEINSKTPVQWQNVRQSHLYAVQVATSMDGPFYDSFAYESIPRGGKGNLLDPYDPSSTTTNCDGVSIEADVNITMAWSQFIHSTDSVVKISRYNKSPASADDIIIRPTTLDYDVTASDGDVYIHVPYSSEGSRFSVEFKDDLYTYRDDCSASSCGLVQNEAPGGYSYVQEYTNDMPTMSVEPWNALLIFASPPLPSEMTPDTSDPSTLHVQPGQVIGLDTTQASTVYFGPGVYYMQANNHANLSSSVNWVHFDAGAYVKGAIQFSSSSPNLKATGYGVLSGEQYVYQANVNDGYKNSFSNNDDLRMWSGVSYPNIQQTFTLVGPTINEQPFNSMDFSGDMDTLTMRVDQYKQVGAWYGQTDGLENYPGSHVSNVFYHSNDDTIKTYYSNVVIENVVVWKGTTAPTVQFGWSSRDISNITVQNIDIIHSRYINNDSHPALIGSHQLYDTSNPDATDTATITNTISNFALRNLRSEGISGNLFLITPLQNLNNFTIENVEIEQFPAGTDATGQSHLQQMTNEEGWPVALTNVQIKGFSVNGTDITQQADNWAAGDVGGLNLVEDLLKKGVVSID
ncbi:MAG: hypothetical protein Q9227_001351 [Pyrenula ochraceoflavens]